MIGEPKETSPFTCKVAGFYEDNAGKLSSDQANKPHDQIIIEVGSYLKMVAPAAPQEFLAVDSFRAWLLSDNLSLQFVQFLMMTLPEPRHEFYQSANYDDI